MIGGTCVEIRLARQTSKTSMLRVLCAEKKNTLGGDCEEQHGVIDHSSSPRKIRCVRMDVHLFLAALDCDWNGGERTDMCCVLP